MDLLRSPYCFGSGLVNSKDWVDVEGGSMSLQFVFDGLRIGEGDLLRLASGVHLARAAVAVHGRLHLVSNLLVFMERIGTASSRWSIDQAIRIEPMEGQQKIKLCQCWTREDASRILIADRSRKMVTRVAFDIYKEERRPFP